MKNDVESCRFDPPFFILISSFLISLRASVVK